MTATLSNYALEAMGFRDLMPRASFVASFMSVTIYEARGITVPDGFASARQARVAGAEYRIALSKGVNKGCQCLIGDDFVDSESNWMKEVKSVGPFLSIAIGPTEFVECSAGRMMRLPDGSISTYDSFPGLRQTLASLEDRVLPPVVAAVTFALNRPDRYVSLRKLGRASAGRTPQGTTVRDVRVDIRADLSVARSIDETQVGEVLNASTEGAPKLHQRAAKYFALGVAEDDQLKRFLYLFLSLEVETHAVFGRIDHAQQLLTRIGNDVPSSPRRSTAELMIRDIAGWENLFDRFVWCSTCAWPWLSDEDVRVFKELKNARDAIAHGRASAPPLGYAHRAELLAHKVLWGRRGGAH